MFSKRIHDTTLASEAADRLFSNITASSLMDQSFLATLRALLHRRLPSSETMRVSCHTIHLTERDMTAATVSQCMTWFLDGVVLFPTELAHRIHIVRTVDEYAGEKMLEVVKGCAGTGKRYMSDFTRQDDLHIFYARKAKALFYTDDTGKNTIIFTSRLECKQFHALQMMIPKYLPRLFADNPLTETETSLLKSLGNPSAVEYETWLETFAKDLDIRAEVIRSKLAGFENMFERMKAMELRREIDTHQKDYDHYLVLMREAYQMMQERTYTLAGLEDAMHKQTGDSELMEYFMCNKNLTIIHVEGASITFVAHGYADVYDIDAFERYASNLNGFLYNNLSPNISRLQMEKLYRAIFSDNMYKLRICAAYKVDMRSGLTGLRHFNLPSESRTYFPNPHIQHFGCIGNYAGRFQEYMQKRDYVGAIDQAVVSARNLNFFDSAVMSKFAGELSRTTTPCLEAHDDSLLTPQEAIIQLEGDSTCQDQ